MTSPLRIAIVGHGNLGRGVEAALLKTTDAELAGIYTRRDPATVAPLTAGAIVRPLDALEGDADDIDVAILCGGSRSDLPEQTPAIARFLPVVDSFDTHARIPEHFEHVDAAARAGGNVALISAGWDPGLFSINRVYGEALLPDGDTYTFWGRGLSQGHSDAIRRVPGVAAGIQYTHPVAAAVDAVRSGARPELTTREKHTRECFVVLAEGADADAVREAIVTMPDYFADYDTTVRFIDADELARDHAGMPHGGFVIRAAETSDGTNQVVEYSLRLDSNPELTASVLVAAARAVARLQARGEAGAITLLDVPPALLSPRSAAELRRDLL
ncbi:diaminopimelate dehydrogenase [Sanguibacter sp. HDW7]|uniref:diaminopimelate dehydrogenase n=1 Tax=Sanguibacter sp. HDW7 TaxID=2714931 RepID=UPI00140D43CB|nr:diaminopimelate dehydrogenase [Sanguibacter sp. HDW7]QIK83748.1 diaminopimelate dehydrogenase [Sanguibacter sp. HDW7]